jgi:four helix bundle protein
MPVRDFRDLVAWQLTHQLKCEVFDFTATGAVARDFKYCDQIRDSSAAAARDIAEGFGRYRPAEFARFLEYALGSLEETRNSLIDGRDRGYLEGAHYTRLWNLAAAAQRTTKSLWRAKQRQIRLAKQGKDRRTWRTAARTQSKF